MIRHKFMFFSLLIFCCLAGCDSYLHQDFEEFPDHQWTKSNIVSFDYTPSNQKTKNSVILTLRYNTAMNHDLFQFSIVTTTPSGKNIQRELDIARKDADGNHLGEEMGGYGDIDKAFLENFIFEDEGTYKFQITHRMPPEQWGGVLGVGIKILETQ